MEAWNHWKQTNRRRCLPACANLGNPNVTSSLVLVTAIRNPEKWSRSPRAVAGCRLCPVTRAAERSRRSAVWPAAAPPWSPGSFSWMVRGASVADVCEVGTCSRGGRTCVWRAVAPLLRWTVDDLLPSSFASWFLRTSSSSSSSSSFLLLILLHHRFSLTSLSHLCSASEMTYIVSVSGGALNSTHSLTSHLCGSSRGSLRFCKYFCRRKAAVALRKVAKGWRFDYGQNVSFTVFAVYLRFANWSIFDEVIRRAKSVTNFSTTLYILPRLRTKLELRAFYYVGPQAWNALPENIHHETNPNCFKRQLKMFLFCRAFNRPSHYCACHFDGHHSPDDRSALPICRTSDLVLTATCSVKLQLSLFLNPCLKLISFLLISVNCSTYLFHQRLCSRL